MTQTPEEIYLLNKKLKLLQPEGGFRSGLDTVLLAAACPAKAGDHILDLGTGVGGAGFCVLKRVPDTKITGVEIQEDHVELAIQNASLNDMADRAHFMNADICDFSALASPRKRGSDKNEQDSRLRGKSNIRFDHVIINPPYLEAGTHLVSPDEKKARAHGHGESTLKDWIDAGHQNLKSGGSLTMIHRADQADKIIQGLGKRFGATEIIPLWPKAGVNAKRVIIRTIKDRRSPALIHAGLILHSDNGEYTLEADEILRNAEALI